MAGKPITRGSARVAYAIDNLSKNTLADIVLDRIAAEIGEDATDEQVLAHLQPWLDTVQRLRGDKPVHLAGLLARRDRHEAAYLERQRLDRERQAEILAKEKALAAAVAEHNREQLKKLFKPQP